MDGVTRFCVITKWRQHLSPSHANKVTSPKSPETTWPHENMTGKPWQSLHGSHHPARTTLQGVPLVMSASLAGLSKNGWRDTILRHHEVAPTLVSKPCQQGHFTKITRNHLATRKHDRQSLHGSHLPGRTTLQGVPLVMSASLAGLSENGWRDTILRHHEVAPTLVSKPCQQGHFTKITRNHTFLAVPLFRVSR